MLKLTSSFQCLIGRTVKSIGLSEEKHVDPREKPGHETHAPHKRMVRSYLEFCNKLPKMLPESALASFD